MEIVDLIRDLESSKAQLAAETMMHGAGGDVYKIGVQIGTYRGMELALGLIRKGLETGEKRDTLSESLRRQEKLT